MKTKLLFLSLLFCYLAGYSQFTLKGTISNYNTCYYILSYIAGPDSSYKWFNIDNDGFFEYQFNEKGNYTLKLSLLNHIGSTNTINLHLDKDTSVMFPFKYPELKFEFAYKQPCRTYSNQNNYILNLPTNTYEYEKYKVIQRSTDKLNLPNILNDTVNIILRIWEKPAFQYGGGAIYEVTETMNKQWTLKIIKFISKSKEYSNSPDEAHLHQFAQSYNRNWISKALKYTYVYQSMRYNDNNHGDRYYSEQVRTTSIRQINIEKDWFTENGIDYLIQFINSTDYCTTMAIEDKHMTLDGVSYFVELKNKNNYSFTSYGNPEKTELYEQIDSFVKIMELLKKRLSDKKNSQ